MNKISCNIIMDILPLYADDIVSEDTKNLVEMHLQSCDECRRELSLIKSDFHESKDILSKEDDLELIKKVGKDIKKKRNTTGLLASIISVIAVILAFAYLTAPEYIPYRESSPIISISESNGNVALSFRGEYELSKREPGVYSISVYNTILNELTDSTKEQTIIVNPKDEAVNRIYYVSNGDMEDKVIYGVNPISDGGVYTLPRLFLNYYFIVVMMATLLLAALPWVFRKNLKIKTLLIKLLLVPVSYVISHVAITGLSGVSYSATRDFYLILFLTIPIYLLLYVIYSKRQSDKLIF